MNAIRVLTKRRRSQLCRSSSSLRIPFSSVASTLYSDTRVTGRISKVYLAKNCRESDKPYGFAFYTLSLADGSVLQCCGVIPKKVSEGTKMTGLLHQRVKKQPKIVNAMGVLQFAQSDSTTAHLSVDPISESQRMCNDQSKHADSVLYSVQCEESERDGKMSAKQWIEEGHFIPKLVPYVKMVVNGTLEHKADPRTASLLRAVLFEWNQCACFDTEYLSGVKFGECEKQENLQYRRMYEMGMHCHWPIESTMRCDLKIPGMSMNQRIRLLSHPQSRWMPSNKNDNEKNNSALLPGELCSEMDRFLENGTRHLIHHRGLDSVLLSSLFNHYGSSELKKRVKIHDSISLLKVLIPQKHVRSQKIGALMEDLLPQSSIDLKTLHTADVDARCLSELLSYMRSVILGTPQINSILRSQG